MDMPRFSFALDRHKRGDDIGALKDEKVRLGIFRIFLRSLSGKSSGIGGLLGIAKALADQPQLPNKQSNLNGTDNHQPESEKSSGITSEPWTVWIFFGFLGGIIGGISLGWLATR